MRLASFLSWFGRLDRSFLVPAKTKLAAARSRGQGRLSGRRARRAFLDCGEYRGTLAMAGRMSRTPRVWRATAVAWMLATSLSVADLEPAHAAELAQNDREIPRAIDEASLRFGIPTGWIEAVIAAESAGDRRAVSVKGAMGLMQLMPGTWRDLRADLGLGVDPFNPRDNILAGTAYLRRLLDRFGPRGFLAAYNAGPARYQDFMAGTRRLPSETVAYVARVEAQVVGQDKKSRAEPVVKPRDWRVSDLFPGQDGGGEHDRMVAEAAGLFVQTGQGGRP
jgi:hypothetical protein